MRLARLTASLCLLCAILAPLARGDELAERTASCRSWAAVLAQAADARTKEGDDRPLDSESLVRTELSDVPSPVLDGMLALAARSDRERWSPDEARQHVEADCPGWFSTEKQ
jgi:hypothetical protein